jgi:hypothetical protein
MTFNIDLCYIVTPLARQRAIAQQLISHWKDGFGREYNPDRAEALEKISIKNDVSEVLTEFRERRPVVIGTSSKKRDDSIRYSELQKWIREDPRSFLLLFGTGWGLPAGITETCEKMLLPIRGNSDYNHLSLRVAIGIILDRLFGDRDEENCT